MSGRKLLRKMAASRGQTVEQVVEDLEQGNLQVAGPDGDALRDAAKTVRKDAKLQKWRSRAAARGQDWDQLPKAQRKVFKLAWRADRALEKLSAIVAARDAKGGAPLRKATGAAASRHLTEAEIVAANLARTRSSL
jgi:hypothetical protein